MSKPDLSFAPGDYLRHLATLSPDEAERQAVAAIGLDHAINERKLAPFAKPSSLADVGITSREDQAQVRAIHDSIETDRISVGLHGTLAQHDHDKGYTPIHDPRTDDPSSIYSLLDAQLEDTP